MTQEEFTLRPPVGTKVRCFFGPNNYVGEVVAYGTKYPKVRFRLKNGKVKEGRATIIAKDDYLGRTYAGYLAQIL
jgi:hypothetical protein